MSKDKQKRETKKPKQEKPKGQSDYKRGDSISPAIAPFGKPKK